MLIFHTYNDAIETLEGEPRGNEVRKILLKDLNKYESVEKESDGKLMKENIIKIMEDMKIPGTDIVLEKGDRIKIVNEASYDKVGYDAWCAEHPVEILFQDSNFILRSHNGINIYNKFYHKYEVKERDNSIVDKHAIEVRLFSPFTSDKENSVVLPQEVEVAVGMSGDRFTSVSEKVKAIQQAIAFADKVAKYFKIPFINK